MRSPERFDAALLHVYGYEPPPNRPLKNSWPEKPAKRSRLVAAAARHLNNAGLVDNFVLSGTSMTGGKKALSTLTAKKLYRIEPERVHTNPTAPATTNQELQTLKKEAKEHGWSNMVSISWKLHEDRIKILKDKVFGSIIDKILRKPTQSVTVMNAKDILSTYPNPRNQERYLRVIDGIENSESEKKFAAYEANMVPLLKLPFVPEILDLVARVYRPKAD